MIVFIVPKGESLLSRHFVVETAGDTVLHTAVTQEDAIKWAKANGHTPHVARVRHHWRKV